MPKDNVNPRNRILLDSYLVGQGHVETLIQDIELYNAVGYKFVALGDVIYIKGFQDHLVQLRELVQNGKIVVETWGDECEIDVREFEEVILDDQSGKPNIFEGVIKGFQNEVGIAAMKAVIEGLDLKEHAIEINTESLYKPLSRKMQRALELPALASRYEVFKACYQKNKPNLFRTYNYEYVKRRAYVNMCDFLLNSRGQATRIF